MLDVKMTDQMTGHENAGHEVAGYKKAGYKTDSEAANPISPHVVFEVNSFKGLEL